MEENGMKGFGNYQLTVNYKTMKINWKMSTLSYCRAMINMKQKTTLFYFNEFIW